MNRWVIDLRIGNAIVRVKKGADRIAEYIPAREAEKQPSSRSRLIIHPSARPAIGVLDIWHLERELREALGEEKESTVESLKALAFQGKGSEILQKLMEEGARSLSENS